MEVVVNINMVNYITYESSYKNLSIYCSNSRVTLYFVAIWSSNFFQSSPVPRSQAPKIFQELPSPTLQELLHRLQCEAKTLTTVKHHIKQETSKWRQLSRKWTVLNHGSRHLSRTPPFCPTRGHRAVTSYHQPMATEKPDLLKNFCIPMDLSSVVREKLVCFSILANIQETSIQWK